MTHDIRALIDDAINHVNDALHVLTEAMAILNTEVSYGPTTVVDEDEPALPLEGGESPNTTTTETITTDNTTNTKTE